MNKLIAEVCNLIDSWREEMVDFCKEYLSYPSVVGNELEVQKWLSRQMEGLGFDKVDCWSVDPDGKRPNVVGLKRGSGGGRDLIINGHSDVVPVEEFEKEAWHTDPWVPVVKDGSIYGRGATDMKGPNTAAFFAVKALLQKGIQLKGDLMLEYVVGEERMEHELGTTATVERGYRAPLAIVVEPSNCEIHSLTTGAFGWELFVKGKPTHTCLKNQLIFPQRYGLPVAEEVGVDAFTKSIKILHAWEQLEREWNLRWRHPGLGGGGFPKPDVQGVGCFSITSTLVRAGDFISAVPGYSKIQGNVYYPAWVSVDEVVAEMEKVIEGVTSYDDWMQQNKPVFKVLYHWPPSNVSSDHPGCLTLAQAWQDATGEEAIFSGFRAVADSAFLQAAGIPAIVFGPGDLSMGAHGPNEHIPVEDMLKASKTLAAMVIRWCGTA